MKKKVIILLAVVVCIAVVVAATVTGQDAGFLAKKLPQSIMFETAGLDGELNAGDIISGCYLSGTINGQIVHVVSVVGGQPA